MVESIVMKYLINMTKKDLLEAIEDMPMDEGKFPLPYDWEEMWRYKDLYRRLKAADSEANIRPFGDITNTFYGRLCQKYNEYQQLKLKKRLKKEEEISD